MALVHIDKVEDTHLIAFLFQKTANVTDNLAFGVKHHERGVALLGVGLAEKSRFSRPAAAAD